MLPMKRNYAFKTRTMPVGFTISVPFWKQVNQQIMLLILLIINCYILLCMRTLALFFFVITLTLLWVDYSLSHLLSVAMVVVCWCAVTLYWKGMMKFSFKSIKCGGVSAFSFSISVFFFFGSTCRFTWLRMKFENIVIQIQHNTRIHTCRRMTFIVTHCCICMRVRTK